MLAASGGSLDDRQMHFVRSGDFDEIHLRIVHDLHEIGSPAGNGKMFRCSLRFCRIHIAHPFQVHVRKGGQVHQILLPREFSAPDLCGGQFPFHTVRHTPAEMKQIMKLPDAEQVC